MSAPNLVLRLLEAIAAFELTLDDTLNAEQEIAWWRIVALCKPVAELSGA